jgi:hypothetical protein
MPQEILRKNESRPSLGGCCHHSAPRALRCLGASLRNGKKFTGRPVLARLWPRQTCQQVRDGRGGPGRGTTILKGFSGWVASALLEGQGTCNGTDLRQCSRAEEPAGVHSRCSHHAFGTFDGVIGLKANRSESRDSTSHGPTLVLYLIR